MDATPTAVLRRARTSAQDGALASLCDVLGIELVVVFGSVLSSTSPRDVDLAIRFTSYRPERVLPAIDALADLVGPGPVDVMVLNTAGVVAREQALVHGEPLFARSRDLHARMQIAATMERLDTDHLRREHVRSLAGGGR